MMAFPAFMGTLAAIEAIATAWSVLVFLGYWLLPALGLLIILIANWPGIRRQFCGPPFAVAIGSVLIPRRSGRGGLGIALRANVSRPREGISTRCYARLLDVSLYANGSVFPMTQLAIAVVPIYLQWAQGESSEQDGVYLSIPHGPPRALDVAYVDDEGLTLTRDAGKDTAKWVCPAGNYAVRVRFEVSSEDSPLDKLEVDVAVRVERAPTSGGQTTSTSIAFWRDIEHEYATYKRLSPEG